MNQPKYLTGASILFWKNDSLILFLVSKAALLAISLVFYLSSYEIAVSQKLQFVFLLISVLILLVPIIVLMIRNFTARYIINDQLTILTACIMLVYFENIKYAYLMLLFYTLSDILFHIVSFRFKRRMRFNKEIFVESYRVEKGSLNESGAVILLSEDEICPCEGVVSDGCANIESLFSGEVFKVSDGDTIPSNVRILAGTIRVTTDCAIDDSFLAGLDKLSERYAENNTSVRTVDLIFTVVKCLSLLSSVVFSAIKGFLSDETMILLFSVMIISVFSISFPILCFYRCIEGCQVKKLLEYGIYVKDRKIIELLCLCRSPYDIAASKKIELDKDKLRNYAGRLTDSLSNNLEVLKNAAYSKDEITDSDLSISSESSEILLRAISSLKRLYKKTVSAHCIHLIFFALSVIALLNIVNFSIFLTINFVGVILLAIYCDSIR